MGRLVVVAVFATSSLLASGLSIRDANAANGTWNVDASGNWSDTDNWAGGPPGIVADGVSSSAGFANDITGDRTITLDTPRTIGPLAFSDSDMSTPGGWTIDGTETLTLWRLDTGRLFSVGGLATGKVATIKTPINYISGTGLTHVVNQDAINEGTVELSGSAAVMSLPSEDSSSGGNFQVMRGTFAVRDGATLDLRYKGPTPGFVGPAVFLGNVGTGGGGNGFFAQSGETSSVLIDSSMTLGRSANSSSGTYTISGGTLTVSSTVGGNGFVIVGRARPGTFNQSGGTVTIQRNNTSVNFGTLFIADQGANGTYSLTGGTLNVLNWANNSMAVTSIGKNETTGTGVGLMTINGATAAANLSHVVVGGAIGTGTLDLQNGVLRSQNISKGTTATATFRLGSATGAPLLAPYDTYATFGSATAANNLAITLHGSGATISSSDKDGTGRTVDVYSNIGQNAAGRALTFDGVGTTNLRGTNTYTGDTTINSGTLVLGAGGSMLMDVNSTGDFTEILGTGSLTLDGILNMDVTDVGGGAQSWTLINTASLTESYGGGFGVQLAGGSSFSELSDVWTLSESGRTWSFTESTGEFSVSSGPEGDFNEDGFVDAADYVIWRKGFGTTYDQGDYDTWRANFGAESMGSSNALPESFGTVPEPSTMALLALLTAVVIGRRGCAAGRR
ncbi:MAG: PEP-CTERM sorting domain-containing protein [Pirellulales bacterium]